MPDSFSEFLLQMGIVQVVYNESASNSEGVELE